MSIREKVKEVLSRKIPKNCLFYNSKMWYI